MPVPINDQRCWQTRSPQNAAGFCAGVVINGEILNSNLVIKTKNLRKIATIDRQGDNFKILTAKVRLQIIQRWHFFSTWSAPCCPEIEYNHTPLKILESALITVGIKEGQLGHRTAVGSNEVEGQCRLTGRKGQEYGAEAGHQLCPQPPLGLGVKGRGARSEVRERFFDRNEHRLVPNHVDNSLNKQQDGRPKPSSRGVDLWGGHFADGPAPLMEQINASIGFDKRLYAHDLAGSRAHARMLEAVGILTTAERDVILEGLQEIGRAIEAGDFEFSPELEDIHMNIEARLTEKIGEPGRKLHTARSRNDQVATDFRLWLRDEIDNVDRLLTDLQHALIMRAKAHYDWVMPGFTHLQAAQPVTFGHHLMAYVEMLGRDRGRFADGRARLNECPLGAAALAGTSFPIDRLATAAELGFDRPMRNSIDAVSDRDFALEFLSSASITAMHLSRLAEELVLWSTPQFGFVKMSEAFSSGSSIMPQKRNPDAAELLRGKAGRVVGSLQALLMTLKGLPLAYSKDMQEDKEPVFDAVDTLCLCVAASTAMIESMTPDKKAMRAAAGVGFTTATDLADWLVRTLDLPFREAHAVVAKVVRMAEEDGVGLADLKLHQLQSLEPRISGEIFDVLTLERSVASRTSFGGTAPSCVRKAIADAERRYL